MAFSVFNSKWIKFFIKSDGVSSFLRAARAGNLDKILDFLNNGLDINSSNNNGLNALHLASKEGHMKVITELLARGAHVDAVTKKGNTALHIASLAGQEEVVKLLIERGSKVNVQSQNGFTPLYMASQENHSEVVRYLLANNANQALATEDGFTPLAVALQQGHDKVVALLLENDAKGKVKLPALHIAAKKDDVKATTLLLQNEHQLDTTSKSGGMVNDTTKSGFTPLHIAAHYGNMSVGRLLVDRGADVNYKARNSITPLHVASKWGRVAMIQLLLDNNADIEARTRDGLTPLHCAARSGHDQTVDILLERGASVTAKTKNSLTPLHMAAQGDHVDCVRLLLYRKAVIDDITIDYLTPLHVVAHCGNFRTAQLLLDRKCEVNARALNGFTPLHIACKKNRIKIVELLLKYGATIEATTESGLTPLHVASFMGHLNIVIYLLQKGASPNHTTVRGETSLHLAARANQTDILRALLRNGAQIDHAKAREQQTPLHIVARLGNVDNLLLLLQHGASPDALTKDMYTPLHIAAKEGHDEICQILLDHGAKQALKSKRGFTPLHIAAKNGQLRVVKRLVEHGANVDVEGKNGLTPLHVATHYDVVDVALYLLEKHANPHCISKNGYTSLHIAAKKNEMEIALTLLQHGADANAKSKNGFTPLHLATQEGNVDMVAMLLEHSAGPNMQAKNGLVPLHLAAQEDGVPAAEILKHFGVNMNQQTNAGYTPLHTACHFGQVNMVKFLIENGASVNHRTQVGYTPLHQAAQQGHVMVINELLKSGASPDMLTESGQSALSIAQRLGYISVVEILKKVTEVNVEPCQVQEKYKHIFPETMQEVPMSDSDNEGGEEIIGTDPTFLYLANNELTLEESRYKGECDAFGFERSSEKYSCTSSPGAYIDDMKYISGQQKVMLSSREDFDADDDDEVKRMMTLKRKKMMNGVAEENMIASFSDASQTSVQPGEFNPDQLISMVRSAALLPQPPYVTPVNRHVQSCHEALERGSIPPGILNWKSFLVSFMVDARGGAMRGCRHSGVRFIIPPNNICMPTRITCRLVKRSKLLCPPPLMEGESLASRIIEMGPVGVKFAGLIIIEVPHFASLSGKEREILILRSENGETWKEHNFFSSCKISKEAVTACLNELEATEELSGSQQSQHYSNNQQQQQRKICRILSSDLPQYFALVTRIKQETSTIGPEGGIISSTVVPQVQAVFPEGSLTKNTKVGLQVQPVSAELVSKYGGNRVAVSSVVTIEPRRRKFHRPITLTLPSPKAAQKGMVNNYGPGSEAPSVRLLCSIVGGTNAALWEDITDTTPLVFTNNCVSFTTSISARFWLMDCQNTQETVKMASDIYPDVTLVPFLCKFAVFARRTDTIEARLRAFCITDDKCDKILESHDRFELIARSRDVEVLEGRPLYVEMAGNLVPVSKNNEQVCLKAFTPFVENRLPFVVRLRDHHQDPAGLLAFMSEPREVRSRNDKPPTPVVTLNINLPQYVPMEDAIKQDDIVFREKYEPMKRRRDERLSKTEQWILEVSKNMLEDDYAKLGLQLGLDVDDVEKISKQFADVNEKALVVMQAWTSRCPESATGAHLEEALKEIGRSDLADLCPCDVINVTHAVGQAASKVFLDSTGFEALRVELGASSKGSSITRGMSLDVSYDEQDLIKDSGSTMDEFSDIGSTADKFGSQDGVDEVRDDTATPTKEDLPTPIKGSPSLDGFEEEEEEEEGDEEEMSTIKRKPKLIEEEIKIVKRAVHQIGAIPIEIPIATKVITESRLSEIESSYDKSQGRVVNKLNPEPEFEQVELKKPPGYVKDQVRRWENVLTEVDDARSESPPVDVDSDQHDEKQQNGISDEHSRESISTNDMAWHDPPQESKESDVDGRSEEKGDEITDPTDVLLRQTAKDTVFKVLEKFPVEKESLKSAPQFQEVASTSGMSSPQVMETQIHLEERDVPTSSSYDYKNWEKRAALVCEEDEDQGDTNLTLSDYTYATGNHIIDLSFEEKDLIKQSESTDEDDESSLVSSVIDRSELDRKHSERDDSLDKESTLIKWEGNFEETDNLQQRPDKVDLPSDIETDISKSSKSPLEIHDAEKVMKEAQTPEVSPVESQDVYKYIPDTDCYEYRKYRQSETGNQVEIKSDDVIDDITIEMAATDGNKVDHKRQESVTNVEKVRRGLELLCHGDGEAMTLLQENLVDVKQVKAGLEESEPDIIGRVYVQSVVTESPPSTTTIEKKHSLPNGVEVDHKIVTTTKTTALIHTFHSPASEAAKDFPSEGQEISFEEPSLIVTTEHVAEVTEKKYVGAQQILLEDNQEVTRRTTETKSTEVIIERRSGTLEQSAADTEEESKPTEPEESVLEETVQTVHNRDDEFLDNLGLDIGPVITVTEDNSSPVDDDDFVGYYGLQSYMRDRLGLWYH